MNWPLLDADRDDEDAYLGRTVLHELPAIEPYLPITDSWVAMPVRIAHNVAAGTVIELGPYTLGRSDIQKLRHAFDKLALEETR
jgi:hypothetical protein